MKNIFPDMDDDCFDDDCLCGGCGETYTNCICDQDDFYDDDEDIIREEELCEYEEPWDWEWGDDDYDDYDWDDWD